MFFVVETKEDAKVVEFVDETKNRLKSILFGVSKFELSLQQRDEGYYRIFVAIEPYMSNTMVYVALLIFIPAVLFGWGAIPYMFTLPILSLKYFETKYFGKLLLKKGLSKKGYTDYYREIQLTQLVEEAIIDGAKRNIRKTVRD